MLQLTSSYYKPLQLLWVQLHEIDYTDTVN